MMKAFFVSRSSLRVGRWGLLGSCFLTASVALSAPAGSVDPTFQVGPLPGAPTAPALFTFAIQRDDRILLGGSFAELGGLKTPPLARLLPNGQIDPSYRPNLNVGVKDSAPTPLRVASILLLPDDRAVFDGSGLTDVNGQSSRGVRDSTP